MTGDQPEPLDLRDEDALDIGRARDFHILLRALDQTMPADATLVLEGDRTAPSLRAFLRAHRAPAARELVASDDRDVAAYHLQLADGNLGELRVLAEDCIASEVALHLVVYRNDEVLLWARDAGNGHLLVAKSLGPEVVEELRAALGMTLEPHKRFGWFGLRRVRDE